MTTRNLAIFTICSNNYVPMAKVLIDSARAHHPDARLFLCLADKVLPDRTFYPDCELIAAEDLEIPEFPQFAFRYGLVEFNTALKPFMFLHLLRLGFDAALYFDPDIEIFAKLGGLLEKLAGGASFLLTPHLLQPAEGDADPDDVDIMRAGIYNLGFLGVGATGEARSVLAWWARRLRYQCINDQGNGLFVDQRFIDLVPGFAEKICILREPGYNVAYWNLTQRELTEHGGEFRVNGRELGFFHFSGFEAANTARLSKHTRFFSGRNGRANPAPLQALLRHYAERVTANGYLAARDLPYGYGSFSSGRAIPPLSREIFRTQYAGWQGDPFTAFHSDVPLIAGAELPQKSAAELQRQVLALRASTSWRITSPLRMLSRWRRREFGPSVK
jgi:hypothetical protein